MGLEYNTCCICGDVVGAGRDICPDCALEHGTKVKKLKTGVTYSDDYAFDWFKDGRVSDGYTEDIGRRALEDLLQELKEKSEKSRNGRSAGTEKPC